MAININKFQELLDVIGTDDLKELVSIYLTSTPEVLQNIHLSYEKEDDKNLRFWGHRLKGSSSTLGFDDISDMGKNIEKKGEASDFNGAKPDIDSIDYEFQSIKLEIQEKYPHLL